MKKKSSAMKRLEGIEVEAIRARESVEMLRTNIAELREELESMEKTVEYYKEAEKKNLLVVLPVSPGSMTYRVIPDPKRKGKYTYTQHIFTLQDLDEYGKTVFKSDTEAMVEAMKY